MITMQFSCEFWDDLAFWMRVLREYREVLYSGGPPTLEERQGTKGG